jgi:hypothetical protein
MKPEGTTKPVVESTDRQLRKPAAMIVKLIRPEGERAGPWLVCGPEGILGVIEPGPLLEAQVGRSGYVHAEPTEAGWDIGGRAADQPW